jgi:hypothetical protein
MKKVLIGISLALLAAVAWAQGAQILNVLYLQVRCKTTGPDSAPTDHVRIYCLTSDDHVRQINDAGSVIDLASGGGGGNSFETQNVPSGTDPVADSSTDTLNWTSTGSTVTLTGDSSTDTINVEAVDVTCTGCLGSTEIAGLDAGDITTGTFGDARIDGALEENEIDLLDLGDAAAVDTCSASEIVRRNSTDANFECQTTPWIDARDYSTLQDAIDACPEGLGGADTAQCYVLLPPGVTQISAPLVIGDPEFSTSSNSLDTNKPNDGRIYGVVIAGWGKTLHTTGTEFSHGGSLIEYTGSRPTQATGVTVNFTDNGAALTADLDCAACTFSTWGYAAGDIVEVRRATASNNNSYHTVLSVASQTKLVIADRETDGGALDIVTETGTGDEEIWPYRPVVKVAGARTFVLSGFSIDGDHNEDGSGANVGIYLIGDNAGSGFPTTAGKIDVSYNDIYGIEGNSWAVMATGHGGDHNDQVDSMDVQYNSLHVTGCAKVDSSQSLTINIHGSGSCVYDTYGFDLKDGQTTVSQLNILSASGTSALASFKVPSDQDLNVTIANNEFEVSDGDIIQVEKAESLATNVAIRENRIALQGDPDSVSAVGADPETGTSTASTRTTLTDSGKSWTVNQWAGFMVFTAGQIRRVTSNTSTALTITPGWDTNPGAVAYRIYKNYGFVRLYGSRTFDLGSNIFLVADAGTGEGGDLTFDSNGSTNPAHVYSFGNTSSSGTHPHVDDQNGFSAYWCDSSLSGTEILNAGSYTTYSASGAPSNCYALNMRMNFLQTPAGGGAAQISFYDSAGTVNWLVGANSGELRFMNSASVSQAFFRTTAIFGNALGDVGQPAAGFLDQNATGWFWDENQGGSLSGTEGYLALGTAPKGTGTRCARFDANGLLVAASGDCPSGDTGGGGGISYAEAVAAVMAGF